MFLRVVGQVEWRSNSSLNPYLLIEVPCYVLVKLSGMLLGTGIQCTPLYILSTLSCSLSSAKVAK